MRQSWRCSDGPRDRSHVLAGLLCSLSFEKFLIVYRKYRVDQARDPQGRFVYEGGGSTTRDPDSTGALIKRPDSDVTGDPIIDAVTDTLFGVASEVHDLIGDGEGAQYGSLFHHEFARRVRRLGIPDISAEVTFDKGVERPYASPRAIRTDVVLRAMKDGITSVYAIWDLKTGGARVSSARAEEIRERVGVGRETPLIEIQTRLGIRNKEMEHVLAIRSESG